MPVRVEYELTRKGRALATAMDAIAHWADKWVTLDETSRVTQTAPATRAAARAPSRSRQSRPSTKRQR